MQERDGRHTNEGHMKQMEELEAVLNSLFQRLQWIGDVESLELVNTALTQVAALQAQEKLIAEIF